MNGVHRLFRKARIRKEGDDGRILPHESERAVFELARRIAFARKIAHLFEFETAFDRGGVVRAPPDEIDALLLAQSARPHFDLLRTGERILAKSGEGHKRGSAPALQSGERGGNGIERGKLRAKALGRGDRRFPARVRQKYEIGKGGQRGIGHIGERQHLSAPLLCKRRRGEGIRRLPALTDGNNERPLRHDGIAVTVFARDIHFDGHAGERLDGILCRDAAVISRPAGDDLDIVCLT